MMWQEFLVALSLVFVIEGIFPFLSPGRWRRTVQLMGQFDDRTLRLVGFFSMVLGLGLLYLVH